MVSFTRTAERPQNVKVSLFVCWLATRHPHVQLIDKLSAKPLLVFSKLLTSSPSLGQVNRHPQSDLTWRVATRYRVHDTITREEWINSSVPDSRHTGPPRGRHAQGRSIARCDAEVLGCGGCNVQTFGTVNRNFGMCIFSTWILTRIRGLLTFGTESPR